MLEEQPVADDCGHFSWWLIDSLFPDDANGVLTSSGVEAGAPEFSRFSGYCAWLITFTNSPCNRAAPDPVACLGAQGVDIAPDVLRPKLRPRAASSRRRRAHTIVRGKSSDPDDGDGPSPGNRHQHLNSRRHHEAPSLAYSRSRNDRASVAATAILQIISDAEDGPDLPGGELHLRLWRFLHDEFDDIEATVAHIKAAANDQ
jgi:hypothetical protein